MSVKTHLTRANRIRGYTDKTHRPGFQILKVRAGGREFV
jgi:hypothetical protein